MYCGCDEAGRGPVIGPMVVAVVCGNAELMKNIGARDSKTLSEGRREALFTQIQKLAASVEYRILGEEVIDEATFKNELNLLEARAIAGMIKDGNEYTVDSPDVKEERFASLLISLSGNTKIVAEHKADVNYPLVSAASIIAKVIREREVASIKQEIGDFGSGYPSDPKTIWFLKTYSERNGSFPPHTRRSWKTLNRINRSLEDY